MAQEYPLINGVVKCSCCGEEAVTDAELFEFEPRYFGVHIALCGRHQVCAQQLYVLHCKLEPVLREASSMIATAIRKLENAPQR